MAVSLSESAAKEVKKIITDQNLPEDTVLAGRRAGRWVRRFRL